MGGLLGAIAPRFELAGGDDFWGKNFASAYFALTMLSAFDGCHFFVPTVADVRATRQALETLGYAGGIEVYCALELPERLATGDYAAFHVPDLFADMAALCHLRKATGANFRITALTHSLSYPAFDRDVLEVLMAPTTTSDLVFCSSEAGCQALLNLFAHVRQRHGLGGPIDLSLAVLPFGVDVSRFAPRDRGQACQAAGLPADRHYFLSVARLSIADKFDCAPLLEAFRRAAGSLQERWDLVLAGGSRDPGYLTFLEAQIRDRGLEGRVHLLANFPDNLKPALYGAADVFVSPSDNLQETFGVAVIEAMACGLPVVGSDWDGYKDTIADGLTGLRVPTYMPQPQRLLAERRLLDNSLFHLLTSQSVAVDVNGLAQALGTLAASPSLRRQLGDAGRDRAVERYSYEAVGEELRRLLEEADDPPDDRSLQDPAPEDEPLEALLAPSPPGGWTPFGIFGHYPTRELTGGDRLVASTLGREALERTVTLYLCDEMELLLYSDLLRPLIRASLEPRSLDDLLGLVPDRDPERMLYSVYWLVKQGLLDLAG